MKRCILRGISTVTLAAIMAASTMAAEVSLSFNKQSTAADVQLLDVGADRYAAEVTLPLTNPQNVQFKGKSDTYAITINSSAGTVTLYAASTSPLTDSNGTVHLGTLTVAAGTEVSSDISTVTMLDRTLNRFSYVDAAITVRHDTSNDGSQGSSGSSSNQTGSSTIDRTPSVSVNGVGGSVKAASDGSVSITPDNGYRIEKILVNGKEVSITTRLTGLKASDKVVVTFSPIETTPVFTDVSSSDWFASAVEFVVSKNLFRGMSDTEFCPDVVMSRAMLVTVLYRMSGEEARGNSGFSDVPVDAWYASAVAWAKENNIVQGMTETAFAPDNAVTREQMVTILYRYTQRYGTVSDADSSILSAFNDASSVSPYAASAVSWAVQEGLISGVGDQTLAPSGLATRAQVAVILQRFLEM